ncbi:hypothetical protein [Longimicrobium sp.]|uniref:hypothetical protein n=1 Tax=Longimicrobium sp. TaxID=2029185 RepID=UPI003B3A769C
MKTHARTRLGRFAPLLALFLMAGCADLGVDPGGGELAGLVITDNTGVAVVTVNSANSVTGSLTVVRNGQRPLSIGLRNASGGVLAPGVGQTIRVTITNTQLATWVETTTGIGTLRGGSTTGTTTLRVDVITSGTVEYTTPAITLNVT